MTVRRVTSALVAALVLGLAGCGGDEPPATAAATTAASAAGTFTNPVFDADFPDPAVLRTGSTWVAYGTNGGGENVPTLTSPDLVTWADGPDALPEVGRWALAGNTWAPEVIAVRGRYLLFYTARSEAAGVQCLGRAVATAPGGPFVDPDPAPLVCEPAEGGSIDASPFADADGKLYLYWKNDGNCCGKPVHLYGRALTADGMRLTGPRVDLLTNTQAWQGDLVEAPEMVRHGAAHVLFYSANGYASDDYAMGYATCRSALGPCTDTPEPVLRSTDEAAGPGHGFVVGTADGDTWLLYHAWPPDSIGSTDPGRQLWLDRLDWEGDRPVVRGPNAEPQPGPAD